MLNAILNIQKSSTSIEAFQASLSPSLTISLFLCFCGALLLSLLFLFQIRPRHLFSILFFILLFSEMEASVENGLRAFPSAISKPLLPLPVSTTPVRQLSLIYTVKITVPYLSHTHNQARTNTDPHTAFPSRTECMAEIITILIGYY